MDQTSSNRYCMVKKIRFSKNLSVSNNCRNAYKLVDLTCKPNKVSANCKQIKKRCPPSVNVILLKRSLVSNFVRASHIVYYLSTF